MSIQNLYERIATDSPSRSVTIIQNFHNNAGQAVVGTSTGHNYQGARTPLCQKETDILLETIQNLRDANGTPRENETQSENETQLENEAQSENKTGCRFPLKRAMVLLGACALLTIPFVGVYGNTVQNTTSEEKKQKSPKYSVPPFASLPHPQKKLNSIESQIPSLNQNPTNVSIPENLENTTDASMLRKKELGSLNHLFASSTSQSLVENPSITAGQNQIQTESKMNFPEDPVTTTETYNPEISAYETALETRSREFTVTSNLLIIVNGTKLPFNSKYSHITKTDFTIINGWRNEWKLLTPDLVHSLILMGSFKLASIQYFINVCKDMASLEFSDAINLCEQVLNDNDYKPTLKERYPTRLQSIKLSSIGFPCENLYTFLVERFKKYTIKKFELKDISIQYENIDLIRKFLSIHQSSLENIHFDNVTICGDEDCALFNDLKFPNLKEVKLYFSRGDMASSKKSLANLNIAAKRIHTFQSKVQCYENERKTFVRNWRKLDSGYDLCTVIRTESI